MFELELFISRNWISCNGWYVIKQTNKQTNKLELVRKTCKNNENNNEMHNPSQTARPRDSQQKREPVRLTTGQNWKYLDLAWELEKLWNMKVTVIPVVIEAFGTDTTGLIKGLEDLEIRGPVETIQTTASLRSARILRRVRKNWGLLSLRLQWC